MNGVWQRGLEVGGPGLWALALAAVCLLLVVLLAARAHRARGRDPGARPGARWPRRVRHGRGALPRSPTARSVLSPLAGHARPKA